MFKKHKADLSARVLPLRNANILSGNVSVVLKPNHIWFTPELIVYDAYSFISELVWSIEAFKKILPFFVLRIVAFIALGFVIINPAIEGAAIAQSYSPSTKNVEKSQIISSAIKDVQIQTSIVAGSVPTRNWPVPRTYISTYYSGHHPGIDIPNPYGMTVKAFEKGTVIFAAWDGGYGKAVVIRHGGGMTTRYAHLSAINVRVGEVVGAGTTIGRVGNTGFSTGFHLHFEVHDSSGPLNPISILP